MELTNLLKKSIKELDTLKKHYSFQESSLLKQSKSDLEKHKYSLALSKYFLFKYFLSEDSELDVDDIATPEDIELAESILDDADFSDTPNGKKILYKLKNTDIIDKKYDLNPDNAVKSLADMHNMSTMLGNSTIIMLLIKYEETITRIFKYVINKYPSAYLNKKSITYSDILKSTSSIDEIKNYLLEDEIACIMRSPLSDWYDLLSSNHKLNFNFRDDYFEKFKEIYYRRNIIVHNNSKVNKIYLDNVSSKIYNNAKVGDTLPSDSSYIKDAFQITQIILYETFFKLLKICEDPESLNNLIFDMGFEHMINKEWVLSEFVYSHLMNNNNQESSSQLCCKVNYWISLKNRYGIEHIQPLVNDFDVSASSLDFKVAKYALLDDFDQLNKYLEQAFNNTFSTSEIETWPLFIQYRSSSQYDSFRKLHSTEFDHLDYIPEIIPSEDIEDDLIKDDLIE